MIRFVESLKLFLGSKYFWIAILGLITLQGIWYAISFSPTLFDEARHLDFIYFYSETLNPFISIQTPAMDYLGQAAREPSYLYYYLMSFPLRLISLVTDNYMIQVIFLRLINVGIFLAAVYVFRKIFLEIGFSKSVANVSLLVFALLPVAVPMAGVVSYDVGVLLFIALIILFTVRIYKKGTLSAKELSLFIVLSVVASVIKYTALPIVLAAVLVIVARVLSKRKLSAVTDIKKSFLKSSLLMKVVMIVAVVFSLAIFAERPLQNIVSYRSLNPSCLVTLPANESEQRCSQNYVYERSIEFLAEKPDNFVPAGKFQYIFNTWIPWMIVSIGRQVPETPSLSLLRSLLFVAVIAGFILTLVMLREILKKHKAVWVLLPAIVIYAGSVYVSNYSGYAELGQPVAISARYLIPIIPLCIMLAVVATKMLLQKKQIISGAILTLFVAVLATQGGGLTTYIMQTDSGYYWKNGPVNKVNEFIKPILSKVVKN